MAYLAAVMVLTIIWHVASSHWYCNNLVCPPNYSVFVRDTTDIHGSETGNCFFDGVQSYHVSRMLCAALCTHKACMHFIVGAGECLLLGVGAFPSPTSAALFRGADTESAFYEVARAKPVIASSVQPSSGGYSWDPETANDGNTFDDYQFFHSSSEIPDPNPNIQIDLGKSYAIHTISFLPRIQTTSFFESFKRGENLTIYVGSTEVTDGQYAGVYQELLFIRYQNETPPGQLGWSHIDVVNPKCGRYLVVKKEYTSENELFIPLEITEIMAFTRDP